MPNVAARKILFAVFFAGLSWASSAHAVTTLKQVQVSSGSQVDLLFDEKVNRSQIRTEFFNDTIQVVLTDVSVYPAKISSVSGSNLTKIFAYQYAPKLVRCRLTVKGKAEDFKNALQINTSGKVLTIKLEGSHSDKIGSSAAQAQREAPSAEKALLDKVLNKKVEVPAARTEEAPAPSAPAPSAPSVQAAVAQAPVAKEVSQPIAHTEAREKSESRKLGGGKPLPSMLGVFGKLMLVLGIFGVVVLGAKKFFKMSGNKENRASAGSGKVFGAITRFARNSIPGSKEKMIEVLSTHHLGPKKSIAVVRIAGRQLVLGISNESINLITQLGDAESSEFDAWPEKELIEEPKLNPTQNLSAVPARNLGGSPAIQAGPAIFSDLLKVERTRPSGATAAPMGALNAYQSASHGPVSTDAAPTLSAGATSARNVRNQIKSKLEGLKPL